MIRPERKFFREGYKDPQATLDVDLHELWRVRLQHADSGKDQRAEVFQ